MPDHLRADPDQMMAGAGAFEATSTRLRAALEAWREVSGRVGACWGTDDSIAEQFGPDYVEGRDITVDNVETLATTIQNLGTMVTDSAVQLGAVEGGNAGHGAR